MTIDTMQRFEQTNALSQQENDYLLSPDNYNLLDSFPSHQQGGFRPSFYNPFEIKHRRRTSRAQLKILEKSFSENAKPNATTRRILAQTLDMTPRGVQIWFQNRRAKAKLQRRGYKEEDHHHHQTNNGIFSNQPSVLFSQFLANIQANDQSKKLAAHFHSTGGDTWPSWKPNGNAPVSDSIRTVATMAAAKAAGNASMPNFDSNLISCENNGENWRNGIHPLQSKPFTESNQYFDISMRRKSCPVPAASLDLASCHDDFSVQNTFMTPGWYHPMSSFQVKIIS